MEGSQLRKSAERRSGTTWPLSTKGDNVSQAHLSPVTLALGLGPLQDEQLSRRVELGPLGVLSMGCWRQGKAPWGSVEIRF